jgi:hypothetical protein
MQVANFRLHGRVTEAGWTTPLIVCDGDRTPHGFIGISPDCDVTANSTQPTNLKRIEVGSLAWDKLEWLPEEKT